MTARRRTEAEMLGLVRQRYVGTGRNGEAAAFLSHVRDGTGFQGAGRTLDAVVMQLWPSRGLTLSGFEVKCSRKDWLKELREPGKADGFVRVLDYFWLVVADRDLVQSDELPETWGLLARRGNGLTCVKEAPKLTPEQLTRVQLAGLLRSAVYVGEARPEEVQQAARAERERLEKLHRVRLEGLEMDLARERERITRFQEASGIKIGDFRSWSHPPEEVGAAVRLALDGEARTERWLKRLETFRRTFASMAEEVDLDLRYLRGGDGDGS